MTNSENKKAEFIFFGTDSFSIAILNKLKNGGYMPKLIITVPDKPAGRGRKMTSPEIVEWAKDNSVNVKQPHKLDEEFISDIGKIQKWDLFIVASYGKIIPKIVLILPKFQAINVHPSLLPLYRGASPIESAILDDSKETGVTIMLMDEEMDHGPILNQEVVFFEEWKDKKIIREKLATIGGDLLVNTIPSWIAGNIEAQEQDHKRATFTKKISKEMGRLDFDTITKKLSGDIRQNFLKIQALNPWPGTYFFINRNKKEMRVKITSAKLNGHDLNILKVIPEGRREMSYEDFKKGFLN